MSNILDKRRKVSILGSFKIGEDIEKAYTEGIYADTPANRKLGRVGMSYSQYAEKTKQKEQKENSGKKWIDIDYSPNDTRKYSSIDRFKKEIESIKPGEGASAEQRKEFLEDSYYLATLHSSNVGVNHFLNSIQDFIIKNDLQDYFEVKGQYGMYAIYSKGPNPQMILEVDASADGSQTFFREPHEDYLHMHHIGNYSSTMTSYFKKACKKMKELYPGIQESKEKRRVEEEEIQSYYTITKTTIEGKEVEVVTDTNTGLIIGTKDQLIKDNFLTEDGKRKTSGLSLSSVKSRSDKYKEINEIIKKYDIKPKLSYSSGGIIYNLGEIPYNAGSGYISFSFNPLYVSLKKYITPNISRPNNTRSESTWINDSAFKKLVKQLAIRK